MATAVTITGISGYLGGQVCLHFLRDESFKIRGTVRSKTNPKKIEPLKKAFGPLFDKLELIEADLLNEQSIIDACEGSNVIVHTASPFPIDAPSDESILIKPAVEGTLAIMRAAQKHKVSKVIITSSIVAIGTSEDPNKLSFNESDWSHVPSCIAYDKSKTLAEQVAWDFIDKLPKEERFSLVTINPGLILGPNLNTASFSSGDIVKKMLMATFPGMPRVMVNAVDVRDVARAHVQAVKREEANGRRFILVNRGVWFKELGQILQANYGKDYPVKTNDLPKPLIWVGSLFRNDCKLLLSMWGRETFYDNRASIEVLGIDYIPLDRSVTDMAETLIATGYVEDRRKKKI